LNAVIYCYSNKEPIQTDIFGLCTDGCSPDTLCGTRKRQRRLASDSFALLCQCVVGQFESTESRDSFPKSSYSLSGSRGHLSDMRTIRPCDDKRVCHCLDSVFVGTSAARAE
jgi:hypothetical protein